MSPRLKIKIKKGEEEGGEKKRKGIGLQAKPSVICVAEAMQRGKSGDS